MAKSEAEVTVKIDATEVKRLIEELKTSSPAFFEERMRAIIREEIDAHNERQRVAFRAQGLPHLDIEVK